MKSLAGTAIEVLKTEKKSSAGLIGKGLVALALAATSANASAATSVFGKITSVTSDSNSGQFIIYVAGVANGCSVANSFVFKPAQPNYNATVSTALAMFVAGRQVSFGYAGCSNGGTSGYALALDITVQ